MRKIAILAVLFAAVGLLAACGNQHSGHKSSSGKGDHNQADVEFVTGMIPHHQQAVEMADLVPTRAASQRLKELAIQIKGAQQPEIEKMSAWLRAWNQPVPSTGTPEHGGHGAGMMSAEDLAGLQTLSGPAFDKRFAELMIAHHQGAVDSAKMAIKHGQSTEVRKLAEVIVTSQTAEIETLRSIA